MLTTLEIESSRAPSDWQPRSLYDRLGKRLLDVTAAALVLLAAAPILIITIALLMLTMGSSVLLRQERIGLHGRQFHCLKFRTMTTDRRSSRRSFDGPERRLTHKSGNDPRHTQLGRVLRKYSIDELPQLVNVLKGEMSLVGPRPEMVSQASDTFIGHIRHSVRPGLTGWYQVSPRRSTGQLADGLNDDAKYVANHSLRQDLRILAKTALAVVRGTGG